MATQDRYEAPETLHLSRTHDLVVQDQHERIAGGATPRVRYTLVSKPECHYGMSDHSQPCIKKDEETRDEDRICDLFDMGKGGSPHRNPSCQMYTYEHGDRVISVCVSCVEENYNEQALDKEYKKMGRFKRWFIFTEAWGEDLDRYIKDVDAAIATEEPGWRLESLKRIKERLEADRKGPSRVISLWARVKWLGATAIGSSVAIAAWVSIVSQ